MSTMTKRLMGDIKEIMNQTFEDSPPVYVVEEEEDPVVARAAGSPPRLLAMIVGPSGTPYAHGFFIFRISVDESYPNSCPAVRFLSTDGGRTRMNPNLYSNGKVCLSILGTWPGESGDSWRSTYSMLYVLRCLQSMVLNAEPFFNEPGFEKERCAVHYATASLQYNRKMVHETLRVCVLIPLEAVLGVELPVYPSMLRETERSASSATATSAVGALGAHSPTGTESPGMSEYEKGVDSASTTPVSASVASGGGLTSEWTSASPPQTAQTTAGLWPVAASRMNNGYFPFAPLMKRYAYLWLEYYEAVLSDPEVLELDSQRFPQTPFEASSKDTNTASGTYQHENLLERLRNVGLALEAEAQQWVQDGLQATAVAESHYYARQMINEQRAIDIPNVTASPRDENNLFVWRFVLLNPTSALLSTSPSASADQQNDLYDIFEQSMYTVEAIFCPKDPSEPPRLRFLQPIYHPNISPRRGVPFCFAKEAHIPPDRRYLPSTIALMLLQLLALPPLASCTSALNQEASTLCFSRCDQDRKTFLRKARSLAQRTLE